MYLWSEGRVIWLQPHNSSTLLSHLIPLLDGTFTVDTILDKLSTFDPGEVLASLQELYESRLLEEGQCRTDEHEPHAFQLTFLSHFTNDSRGLQYKLSQSRVSVLGLGVLGSLVLTSLAQNGIGHLVGIQLMKASGDRVSNCRSDGSYKCLQVRDDLRTISVSDDSAESIAASTDGTHLLIAAMDNHDPSLLERVNEACLHTNVRWFPLGLKGWEAYVGPTIVPRKTACYKCYDLRIQANLKYYEPYLLNDQELRTHPQTPSFGGLPQFNHALASIAAIEAIKLLTYFCPPTTYGRMLTVDFLTFATQFHDVLKLPRCPSCGEPSTRMPMLAPWTD